MNLRKIVIATDSFKESMSAKEASLAIQDGFKKIFHEDIHYDIIPMADGGEGTTDALKEAHNAKTYTIQYMTHCIETLKLHMHVLKIIK